MALERHSFLTPAPPFPSTIVKTKGGVVMRSLSKLETFTAYGSYIVSLSSGTVDLLARGGFVAQSTGLKQSLFKSTQQRIHP